MHEEVITLTKAELVRTFAMWIQESDLSQEPSNDSAENADLFLRFLEKARESA